MPAEDTEAPAEKPRTHSLFALKEAYDDRPALVKYLHNLK